MQSVIFSRGETVIDTMVIGVLIIFPFVAALALSFMKKQSKLRDVFIFTCCAVIIGAVLYFSVTNLLSGGNYSYLMETHGIDSLILLGDFVLTALIVYYGLRYKRYDVILLSLLQTGLTAWLEFSGHETVNAGRLLTDKLTVMMCLIIGVVGCLICVYAVGYMKEYHAHHKEFKDRRAFFFSMLFVFLGAMFGLVLSNNLIWIYFFWEITSICSFLLIGYTQTPEAIKNSFCALWMNLLGGLGFALAIVYSSLKFGIADLHSLVELGKGGQIALIPVILLAFAALTKSAQMPFSRWLLGAMVAPTPTSALLHSATMVKAGVYLLIRLSPTFAGSLAGTMVTTIGDLRSLIVRIKRNPAKNPGR
jgi:ech hydrogenase subunit A